MKNISGGLSVAEDRLSKLPDDVLLDILERMDTINAIRSTCVVSKRMRKLPGKLSRIDIDLTRISGDAVAEATERVLRARMDPSAVPIRDLRLSFLLRHPDCVSIGRSVGLAMAAGKVVGVAEFDIVMEMAAICGQETRMFLVGDRLSKFLQACPHAFTALTRLSLRNMIFGDSNVPVSILAACGQLESLSFHHCLGLVLRLEHARLVNLEFAFSKFKRVELCRLPRLRRMTLNMTRFFPTGPCISFGSVPQPLELRLLADNWTSSVHGKPLELSQILLNASSVRDLRLDFGGDSIWVALERPERLAPLLDQLRVLTLDNVPRGNDMCWTMFFLEAAPNLNNLRINMGHKGCHKKMDVEWKPSISNFKHKHLAKLTIYGFQPNAVFLGYIRHVKKAAANIIELSMHDIEGRRYNSNTFETSSDVMI